MGGNWRVKRPLWTSISTAGFDSSVSRNALNLYNLPRCLQCYKSFCDSVAAVFARLSLCLWWAARRPRHWALLWRGQSNDWLKPGSSCSRTCSEVRAPLSLDLVLTPGFQWLAFMRSRPFFYIHVKSKQRKHLWHSKLHALRRSFNAHTKPCTQMIVENTKKPLKPNSWRSLASNNSTIFTWGCIIAVSGMLLFFFLAGIMKTPTAFPDRLWHDFISHSSQRENTAATALSSCPPLSLLFWQMPSALWPVPPLWQTFSMFLSGHR